MPERRAFRELRSRITLAVLGVASVVAGSLAAVLWAGHAWLESATLDSILERELEVYLEADTPPDHVQRERSGLVLHRPARFPQPLPAPLARLGPGSHRDVAVGADTFHVLVREAAPGDRAYLLYDVAAVEQREHVLQLALLAGVALAVLASWLASGRIARRVLRPVHRLVGRIGALDLERRTPLPADPDDAELASVVPAINRLLDEIDRLVQRERAFAAAAGHELKTPLTSIRIAAESLAASAPQQRAPAQRIERALAAASQTLDELLALSQAREPPAAEHARLDEWLVQQATPWIAAAADHPVRVVWQLQPVEATLPLAALGIVFTNLLRNALRATAAGEVVVELVPGELRVRDRGEGMTPQQLARAFEPGTRSQHGGSGIGLYIARSIARRHGWTLAIDSAPGRGTDARLRFGDPAAPA